MPKRLRFPNGIPRAEVPSNSHGLRDRIAAALKAQAEFRGIYKIADFDFQFLADAVIRELGLTQQWLVDGIISDDGPRPWEVPCETRWTTEWERFNG